MYPNIQTSYTAVLKCLLIILSYLAQRIWVLQGGVVCEDDCRLLTRNGRDEQD